MAPPPHCLQLAEQVFQHGAKLVRVTLLVGFRILRSIFNRLVTLDKLFDLGSLRSFEIPPCLCAVDRRDSVDHHFHCRAVSHLAAISMKGDIK